MPASITFASVKHSLPDGRVLFSDLNFSLNQERVGIVGRNGVGKSTLLKLISGALSPVSGAVTVTGTIGVLRQTFEPSPGETIASLFGVEAALARLHRIESGAGTETDLAEADWTLEPRLAEALARAGLEGVTLDTPLASLSGGQRTRAGFAALVFAEPDFLLLDEPTNNLDREGRADVARVLAGWRGGAVVVSHDRQLLESMESILELTPQGAARYGGGWSSYEAQKARELAAAEQALARAERRVEEAAGKAQTAAERKARRDGAGSRKAAKGGAPRILLGAQKRRAEETSGALGRLAEQQKADAAEEAAEARSRIDVLQPFTVKLPLTGLPSNKVVLSAVDLAGGYTPGSPVFRGLCFEVRGPERVAVFGPNGSGKSTLLKTITGVLRPLSGEVRVNVSWALLDQEVSLLEGAGNILENFRKINPEADENACRAALARFRFRAGAALQKVATLSEGERLRAGLACVLGGASPPQLLILDEPTNHLDIASLEAVEAGLNAYDGALLVVSHDETFLERVGVTRHIPLR
ncbi:MAG: ABC transporter [Hyphomonas sp. 34-62-18]|nr:ABC-F family ATP-binding cassette domain-containing protein [Hyphomonas sp. 34-62-18]OZB17192.1 MAG: ABC transporter [Hyphomonas sp. 34-62-18]